MTKRIIWSNMDINIENWQNHIQEKERDAGRLFTENEKLNYIVALNSSRLEQLRSTLNVSLPSRIIAIASIGLWNGRKQGYKLYEKLPDILFSECDFCEWYIENNKVLFTGHHHDGTNYVEYRLLKSNPKDLTGLLEKIRSGETLSEIDIKRHTLPLAPYIVKACGW